MIRLARPQKPVPLVEAEGNETITLIDAWSAGEEIIIKPAIYNHPTVKQALRTAQNDKCAYCETRNTTSHDVVEHFRPKNGCRHVRRDALIRPQYFWLAYTWDNLLFACDQCNDAGHKQNLFPLINPAMRATAEHRNIEQEKPLLLDPYGRKDPENHIAWDRDVPRPRNGSRYGQATIAAFRLDEDSLLLRERKKHLDRVESLLKMIESLPPNHFERLASKPVFLKWASNEEIWSAMIRFNLGLRIQAL